MQPSCTNSLGVYLVPLNGLAKKEKKVAWVVGARKRAAFIRLAVGHRGSFCASLARLSQVVKSIGVSRLHKADRTPALITFLHTKSKR